MTSMVSRQPRLVPALSETDEWVSGVCDCCDDVPDCGGAANPQRVSVSYNSLMLFQRFFHPDKKTSGLFWIMVLSLPRLQNHQGVRPVSLPPPAGHVWLYTTSHHDDQGLHPPTLWHQRHHVQRLRVRHLLPVLCLVSDVPRVEETEDARRPGGPGPPLRDGQSSPWTCYSREARRTQRSA